MLRGACDAVTGSGLSRPSRIARYSSRETAGRLAAGVRRLAINNAAFDNAPCGASSAAGFRRGFSHGGGVSASASSLSALRNIRIAATPSTIACWRSEEHKSELQSLMRISYAVFRLKKKKNHRHATTNGIQTNTTHN